MRDNRWQTIVRGTWAASAVAGVLAGVASFTPPESTLLLMGFVGLSVGAAVFVLSPGIPTRPTPRRETPLTLVVALIFGAAIGVCLISVLAVWSALDLPPGVGLAAMFVVGGIGIEVFGVAYRRVSPPRVAG